LNAKISLLIARQRFECSLSGNPFFYCFIDLKYVSDWFSSNTKANGFNIKANAMRFAIAVAIFASAFAPTSGAFAQAREPSSASSTLDDVARDHPGWFTEEKISYKPCPASVVFYPSTRHACLGFPEYPYRATVTVNWHPRYWWRRRGYFF
jgi:hypothetical protein